METMEIDGGTPTTSSIVGDGANDFIEGQDLGLVRGDGGDASAIAGPFNTITYRLFGDDGEDKMTGGSCNDFIIGGRGKDLISAGPGDEIIAGGAGNEKLVSCAGPSQSQHTRRKSAQGAVHSGMSALDEFRAVNNRTI